MTSSIFQNHQWRVTNAGLESKEPFAPYRYAIEAERLTELCPSAALGEFYEWPLHVTRSKDWVDIEAFIEGWTRALEIHAGKYSPEADPTIIARTIARLRNAKMHLQPLSGRMDHSVSDFRTTTPMEQG